MSRAREEAERRIRSLNTTIHAVEETNADLKAKLDAETAQKHATQVCSLYHVYLELSYIYCRRPMPVLQLYKMNAKF